MRLRNRGADLRTITPDANSHYNSGVYVPAGMHYNKCWESESWQLVMSHPHPYQEQQQNSSEDVPTTW